MFHIFLADRTVDHSGLAETAAADTTAHDLQDNTVLGRLDERNQRFFRVNGLGHLHNELLFYPLRDPGFLRKEALDRSVFLVSHLI